MSLRREKTSCVKLKVPEECCRIIFSEDVKGGAEMLHRRTVLDQQMVFHYDKEGRVSEIELLGSQPCMDLPNKDRRNPPSKEKR